MEVTTHGKGAGTAAWQLVLLDPHRLRIHKLSDADRAQFTAVAGCLYSSKRHARVRGDHFVDENHARLDFVDEAFALFLIVCPDTGAETEAHVVGNADRFIDVLHPENGSYRPKEFLTIGGRILRNVG